jgi:hypothetical protein
MTRLLARSWVLVAVAVALLVVAATATAYWRGAGGGSANSALAGQTAITITSGTVSAQLAPGGTGTVTAVASNPNPFAVHFGKLALDTASGTGGFDVDSGHSGCSASALGFTTQTNAAPGWTIPPKSGAVNGSLSLTLAGAATMSSSAANACQGATFTVHLIASAS